VSSVSRDSGETPVALFADRLAALRGQWPEPWLTRRAALTPEAEAIHWEGQGLTYAQLEEAANERASVLANHGIDPGSVVALLLGNGLDFVVTFHALLLRRAVVLPLNTRLTARELGFQLGDSGAIALLHGEGELETLAHHAVGTIGGPTLLRVAFGAVEASNEGRSGELAESRAERRGEDAALLEGALAILYTSGTTGDPKAAVLSHDNFFASAQASAELLGAEPADRWLVCMPLFHVGGLSILLRSCLAGSCAVIHSRFDAGEVDTALHRDGITVVSLVANMLQRLLACSYDRDDRADRPAPEALRLLLLGGGPAPFELLARARALGFPVSPTYGLTEATSQVATRLPGDDAPPLDARLRALPGCEIEVVDEEGRALAAGKVGEISVRGPTLMRGYLGRGPCRRDDEWFRTGDLGRLDEDGRLRVMDRRDDLIVSGGENIYPAEIEAALLRHPAVAEVAVVGRADERFGARPVAYWVPVPGAETGPDLAAHCRQELAGYKVPDAFFRRGTLPRNASGKVLRRLLRESG